MNLVYFVLSCPQDQFDNNGVCQTSCTPLFISADQKYCVPSCSPSQFQIIDLETYCKEKCANNFLWSDSTTCTPTCSQLSQFIAPTGYYCVDNCPPSSKIYSNSTDKYCLNSCPLDAPFSHKINDNFVCAQSCDELLPGSIPNAQNDCVCKSALKPILDLTRTVCVSECRSSEVIKNGQCECIRLKSQLKALCYEQMSKEIKIIIGVMSACGVLIVGLGIGGAVFKKKKQHKVQAKYIDEIVQQDIIENAENRIIWEEIHQNQAINVHIPNQITLPHSNRKGL
ncbi:Hypothetical_protein [Hexamita inflata]|uniref:Hypothetical_protein n=1 Tax=Hexamita inflata TaxID=28002 RepID=A0AA86RFC2_9EUKA|nr:Hypothetical protein HINF_LOCUS27301 [Hexamita inflata]CAI9972258.1 Hypothetical protein HINF_LOCUS59903 [Hexamita inflata]